MQHKIKTLSLFANVGIAETYLDSIGIDVVLANELEEKRVKFYSHLYPKTEVICGDITDDNIKAEIVTKALKKGIDMVIATPPCQGMSTAGKMEKWDVRNTLICHAVSVINNIKPKYVFLENVPEQLKTQIKYDGKIMSILSYLKGELGDNYCFNDKYLINAMYHGVAQNRERAIILLVRKDQGFTWHFPKEQKVITLEDAISKVPSLDPEVIDISSHELLHMFPEFQNKKEKGLAVSKWHYPPKHVFRQVYSMMHTPTGKTAFDNIDKFKPYKSNGKLVKGFKNTYKRQLWDKPGFTITMFNRTIGSQNNVHPGRYIGVDDEGYDLYSDARVLTIYELMLISSLPKNWDIPNWATDHFIRQVIGEGIPPMLVKNIMLSLLEEINENY